ncbi:CRISPR-associated exonuclease, Cas4 family [Trichormus variabilis ATCC 29413]|uniref:CRISPR-associated exonuclease Cas4 n=2 Tax=Anabaena variabilis TaxID=264691 RepID=Q3M5G2_TRIV2|nr:MULTISPECIES: CRISPR-associated protein Cas4 [Nostocaceae]ABA23774.1 CRISPR-associated exonuclease, Cas4 family [Trichormus variabilis ATCC 29413]MBC1213928.1 CRISPR-associated protein Cas4 [Trichormus variabilis ARAD]MBC1256199.1 CRISPR-associated protein Cas4 [Trichormus variabilis V5]MBC1265875.1 CRISPR-associated protein Cas4 [Trichormus variabilis FSR]MBC1300340.1 CRISPR-associated protein Cas4 [Trichormus variabilis N2B]
MNIEYIPIAALNQYAYCSHRCWRMFCAGEFIDNQYTIEGTTLHDRVHTTSQNQREETWQVRAIWLKSEQYKLIGKSDLIEAADGQFYPVEYKRGHKGEWDNDELQVCAQALCLEEMTGQNITTGYIYYAHSHQRQLVEINQELRESAIATIQAVTNLLTTGIMPIPNYSKRCQGCSLNLQCLPKAIDRVRTYQEVS